MTIQIVTCADAPPQKDYYCFSEMVDSCKKFGYDPIILGWGKKWGGLGNKPKLLKRAIEDGTITADRILFIDAFDVVLAASPDEISALASFVYPQAKILWNAEKNCFPDGSLADKHPPSTTPFRYLNSGAAIGDTSAFLAALIEMKAEEIGEDRRLPDGRWEHPNDQDNWMRQFVFGNVLMDVDRQCAVFQTLCGVEPSEISIYGNRIVNNVTQSSPMVFHFNGPAKTAGLREPILKGLGY